MIKWDRANLKEKAKKLLKVDFWSCFIIGLVMAKVAGEGRHISFNLFSPSAQEEKQFITEYGTRIITIHNKYIEKLAILFEAHITNLLYFVISLSIIVFLIKIFVGYPLLVGGKKFFLDVVNKDEYNLNNLKCAFDEGYKNIVKSMFIKNLYLVLWTLLLIIPGIIKFFAYYFVPYILAENPHMDIHEALNISVKMTEGHKWDIFILQLSFIGWFILGSAFFGIGGFFVNPYVYMTETVLYDRLKQINRRPVRNSVSD